MFSQFNDDELLSFVFLKIGFKSKLAVEFGAMDGVVLSNTVLFEREFGFNRILFDCVKSPNKSVHHQKITSKNINQVFAKYNVPDEFDLLSIDIDGNDFHVLNALDENKFRARVVIVEFNPQIEGSKTIVENDEHVFDETIYH